MPRIMKLLQKSRLGNSDISNSFTFHWNKEHREFNVRFKNEELDELIQLEQRKNNGMSLSDAAFTETPDNVGIVLAEDKCFTGPFGGLEKWQAIAMDSKMLRITFRNVATEVTTDEIPCMGLYKKVMQQITESVFEDSTAHSQLEPPVLKDKYQWLIYNGQSIDLSHENSQLNIVGSSPSRVKAQVVKKSIISNHFETQTFSFSSAVDSLPSVKYALEMKALRPLTSANGPDVKPSNSPTIYDKAKGRKSKSNALFQQLLSDEEDLLLFLPAGAFEQSWTSSFTLEDWELIRSKTANRERQHLSLGWAELGKMILHETGNVSTSINCFRRSLVWEATAQSALLTYVQLARLLDEVHQNTTYSGSCEIMDVILQQVNSGLESQIFQTGIGKDSVRDILLKDFVHCRLILQVASWFDTYKWLHQVFAIGILMSFGHLFYVLACYFNICGLRVPWVYGGLTSRRGHT